MSDVKHVLWADDEIDLLKPHIRFLEGKGYTVTAVPNGEDALAKVQQGQYDVILLDEMMPGMGGLATLQAIKEVDPGLPVVLITKSEEESLMEEAIGRRISDYLVKPVNPSQVLLVIKKLTEGTRIQEGQITKDYVGEFNRLQQRRMEPIDTGEWLEIYRRLSDLELQLFSIDDIGLRQAHLDLKREYNRDFARFLEANYPDWVAGKGNPPVLSTDLVPTHVVPRLRDGHTVYVIVIDCMRFDQWLAIQPHVESLYRCETHMYYSVLPTATPYSRNAMFSGRFPRDMAAKNPDWWHERGQDGKGKNNFEAEFLADQLKRGGNEVQIKYLRVFTEEEEQALRREVGTYAGIPLVTCVFNFLDQLTHGRSENRVLRELASDEAAFRSLLESWFSHSALNDALKAIAKQDATVILTSDHGAVQAKHSTLVHGNRETSTNLRHKHGVNLRCEEKDAIMIRKPEEWGLPDDFLNKNYILARDDNYFVYPTNFHEYERLYKNSFQHGGVTMEEVLLPCVVMTPR